MIAGVHLDPAAGLGPVFRGFLPDRGGTFTTSFVLLIIAAAGMYAPYGPYFAYIPELLPAADAAPAVVRRPGRTRQAARLRAAPGGSLTGC